MYTTLVMSAANLHGVMYAGGIRYLVEKGLHVGIANIIASSSGALIGFLFALGMTPDEIEATLFDTFCNIGIPCISVMRLFHAWSWNGILGSQWKKEYIRIALRKKLGMVDINFADFARLTGKNLVVVGSNVTTFKAEYFSADTTPHMSVIEALDITTCIPFVFKPIMYKGSLYVDGGVYNYLPTDIAKDPPCNTLVMYAPLPERNPHPKNVFQFIRSIIYSLMYIKYHENATRFANSIALTTGECFTSVDTLTFKQKIITFPRAAIERMLTQGYDQTRGFVESRPNEGT